jgi:hypothetical protein
MWNLTSRLADRQVHHGALLLQIGTPICTTIFLMVPSLPKQSATLQHLPAIGQSVTNVDKHKKWQKGPPSMNGSKS